MAKGRKRNNSTDADVEVYKHEKDTRKNAVPVGLASYDIAKLTTFPLKSLTTGGMR